MKVRIAPMLGSFPVNPGPILDLEGHKEFLKNRKDKAIYLGINTHINSFDDACPNKDRNWVRKDIDDFYKPKLGIYLGKIIFEREHNKLIPKYIPTSIENLEQELEKINPLWLDELNKDFGVDDKNFDSKKAGKNYKTKSNKISLFCKKSKENITLTKEQALSYIREIHTQNTQIIQAYIDEILKNYGLKPYVFTDEFYDELGELGIITQRQVKGFKKNRLIQKDELKLTMLDFLAKQNRKNEDYIITFDDELFYAYLVWSLEEYVLNLAQGMLQDNISLLFNPAAYIHLKDTDFRHLDEEIHKRYENQIKNLDLGYYGLYFYYEGFFEMDPFDYFSDDRKEIPNTILRFSYIYTPFKSPNVISDDDFRIQFELKFSPSPLGKYYFELTYQRGIYLELIQPYYPTNPPKAWSKEMMKKLDLKLE